MTSDDILVLLAAAGLIVVAGLLVGAETAIGRVSRSRVDALVRERARGAERLAEVLRDRPRYINVLLFLSTVATVTAVALVTYVCLSTLSQESGWGVGWAIALAVGVMVVVSYVVLGVAPRTLGDQHDLAIALRAAGFARLVAALLGPLTTLLILIGNALTPGRGYRQGPFATEVELRELVDLAEADDLIEDDERQMIQSVFDLGDTTAREVMVPRTEMIVIERDKTLRQAISLCLRSGFSRVPVIGEDTDDIVGIVYLRDMVRRAFEHRDAERVELVEEHMRPAYFIPDSKQAAVLLREMQADRVHLAVAIDEYGGTAGLVTIEDILEEIVGEIADEYDTAAPEIETLEPDVYRVSARMNIDDFAEDVGLDIDGDTEGVETVLGLLAKRLGRVPIPGAEIRVADWLLQAEQGEGRRNRIGTVLVRRVPLTPEVEDDDGAESE
jgi:CBS domain containing-hemolysin-like protein